MKRRIRKWKMQGGMIEYRKGYTNQHPPRSGPSWEGIVYTATVFNTVAGEASL